MSRVWDSEKTPATDAAVRYDSEDVLYVRPEFARKMERRARHAEWLMARSLGSRMVMQGEMSNGDMIRAHLADAKQEDA